VGLEANHGQESLEYILNTGVLGHFVFEELDKNKNKLKGFKSNEIIEEVNNNSHYLNGFKSYLANLGLDVDLEKNNVLVNRYIAAEIARQLVGESYYYQIVLKEDKMVKVILK
jgi:carboxyl-terminal processing protease